MLFAKIIPEETIFKKKCVVLKEYRIRTTVWILRQIMIFFLEVCNIEILFLRLEAFSHAEKMDK